MIGMACPPFSWAIIAIFFVLFAIWYVACNWAAAPKAFRLSTIGVMSAMLVALSAMEFPHRRMPVIKGAPSDHLLVIGDSISAGLDRRVPAWPAVMQQATGVPIRNLSRIGATSDDGVRMASEVTANDHVVLVEIGGNDFLAGTPSQQFQRSLEALLHKIASAGRTVVMFELPLLPNRVAYGQIQRHLAAKYGVFLIPKRYFTYVIRGGKATSDGLHLSPEGNRRMASLVWRVLAPVLVPAPNPIQ